VLRTVVIFELRYHGGWRLEPLGDLYRVTAMPTLVNDESSFWSDPIGELIFRYLRERRHILGAAWGFDRGSISEDGESASAVFSCVALSGSGKDELRVSAKKTVAGDWAVTHDIQRDKPR
jgi:hypothetical protein